MKNAVFIGEWKGTCGNVFCPSVREKISSPVRIMLLAHGG